MTQHRREAFKLKNIGVYRIVNCFVAFRTGVYPLRSIGVVKLAANEMLPHLCMKH